MDIFNLLSYINKVSLLAFFVTALVVGYQVYILKKEKTKERTPSIPDFKDKIKSNEVVNYTSLPGSLSKRDNKPANYSKLVLLIISLLTIMVVIFVLILIKRNSSVRNEASISPTIAVLPTSIPKPKAILSPSPTVKPTVALSPSPTVTLSPSPSLAASSSPALTLSPTMTLLQSSSTSTISPTIVPTEIILAQAPSSTPVLNLTNGQKITDSTPKVLPETGSIGKGLLIIGVAISTIFFSFWF